MDMERGEASASNTFWAEHGQPWRTEPEIAAERQAQLAARRTMAPDVGRGAFPFTGVRLERADIEWLLATHEDGRGPVDPTDARQRDRVGLDLRGADLRQARLSGLPLARTAGDATRPTVQDLTAEQRRLAAIDLRGADLTDAHLEGSCLDDAKPRCSRRRCARWDQVSPSTRRSRPASPA